MGWEGRGRAGAGRERGWEHLRRRGTRGRDGRIEGFSHHILEQRSKFLDLIIPLLLAEMTS